MATSAGELIYTVGMDTKGLVGGTQQVEASLTKVVESSKKVDTAQAKASQAVSRFIEALKLEAATVGMSAQQKELYVAVLNGATTAQQNEIRTIQSAISVENEALAIRNKLIAARVEADAKAKESQAAMLRYIDALKTEAAMVNMSAKERELYIASLNGATSAQLKQISAIRDAITAEKSIASSRADAKARLDAQIESLRLEATTAAMSAREKELYIASLNGATAAQQREISSLRDKITASRQAAAAQANGITALRGYSNVLNNATGSNNRFRGGIQQAGYQIQDLVVQLQMGTSAFMAIGQQGSQLAGAFGPGGAVIGAVIALGSALLGLAYNASQAKADLTELAAAGDRIANLRLDTLVKINDASRDLASPERISKYKQLGGQILELTTAYENQQLVTKRLRDENQKLQDDYLDDPDAELKAELSAKTAELNESLRQEADIRSRVNGIQKQQQDLYDEEAKIKSDAEKSTKKASRESESAAKKDLTLREQNNARINDAKLKTQQLTVELSNLKNGTDEITGATSRYSIESATLASQQQLNKDATKQQVAALAEQILAQQRINEEIANQSKISKQTAKFTEFVTEVETDATLKADDPNKTETKKHLANLKRINAFSKMEAAATVEGKKLIHQAEVEEETRHQKELAQIRQDALLSSLDFVSSSTSNILTMLSDAGKESSAMYKILFAAQKAAAIPSMLVATEEGATKALALGPIAGPVMSNVIRGLGYASMGVVAGQAIAGARQFGGPTDPGGIYRLGENNQPEVWKTSAGMFGISGDRGSVTPLSDMQGGGFQQSVSVHNYGNSQVSTRTSPDGKQMEIIINEIASQVENRRGRFSRAMTSGTNTKFKAR